jgi:hypothetical protein
VLPRSSAQGLLHSVVVVDSGELIAYLVALLVQAMDIVHPWTLDESGKPLLPITTFSIAMIHRWVGAKCTSHSTV